MSSNEMGKQQKAAKRGRMKVRSETRERAEKKADEKESWKTCKSKVANCVLHGYPAHTDQGLWHCVIFSI